ncbi:C6 transcription factor [Colletotrichum tofieldiae]|nr:C6 transcription factor [Colletotrichum tofieldiae]
MTIEVYGLDGRLNHKFMLGTKEVLASVAEVADELQQSFALPLEKDTSCISRTSAHLHLLHHQCFECLDLSLEQVYVVFDEMIMAGNSVAKFRKSELQQLESMLQQLTPWPSQASEQTTLVGDARQTQPLENTSPQDTVVSSIATDHSQNESYSSSIPGNMDDMAYDSGLTMAQLLDMANSIEQEDSEWMSQTIVEHSIW